MIYLYAILTESGFKVGQKNLLSSTCIQINRELDFNVIQHQTTN